MFDFTGTVIFTALTFPGSWHDAKHCNMSEVTYSFIGDNQNSHGYRILGDNAVSIDVSVTNG